MLLFLNRRGYAPLTLCRACGHRLQCPSCTAWLVEHRFTARLQCHHCGHAEAFPAVLPGMPRGRHAGAVRARGRAPPRGGRGAVPGGARRADGQRPAAGSARRRRAGRGDDGASLRRADRHPDRRQGPPFPDADPGRRGRRRSRDGRRRSARRRADLSAVAPGGGRAGRAERPGRALLQTYMPEQPVMQALAAGDRDGFLAAEAAARRQAGCRRSAGWRR